MATEYSIHVDDWNIENWEFTGRDLMYAAMDEKGTEQHKEALERANGCGCELEDVIGEFADENIPMMLYAYPLYDRPSDEQIIEISEDTACTVVMNNGTEDYFLALCGGGMDLSQDIALAYIIAQGHIPDSLALNVSTQEGLSKYKDEWKKVMSGCKDSLKSATNSYDVQIKRIDEAIKEYDKIKKDGTQRKTMP